jgi:hypothetical protein
MRGQATFQLRATAADAVGGNYTFRAGWREGLGDALVLGHHDVALLHESAIFVEREGELDRPLSLRARHVELELRVDLNNMARQITAGDATAARRGGGREPTFCTYSAFSESFFCSLK